MSCTYVFKYITNIFMSISVDAYLFGGKEKVKCFVFHDILLVYVSNHSSLIVCIKCILLLVIVILYNNHIFFCIE